MANIENRAAEARKLGREACTAGKSRAPALNAKCMILVNNLAPDELAAPILLAFLNGWDVANLNSEECDVCGKLVSVSQLYPIPDSPDPDLVYCRDCMGR